MKSRHIILIVCMVAAAAVVAKAQAAKFPGVSTAQLKELQRAKLTTPLPLPTWLPAGFKLEKIELNLGRSVKIYERSLVIIYSNKLADGRTQRFALEAGFDGLGDLMYEGAKTISSPVGKIHLYYEPKDPDTEGEKLKNYVMTEWFDVGGTAFHYIGWYGGEEKDDPSMAMISMAHTEKILRSLRRF